MDLDLKTLSEIRGVSGHEADVRRYLTGQLSGQVDEVYSDTMGNLFAVGRGELPGPVVMLAAHMDEVGFLVTGVDKEGMVHFANVGGIVPAQLPSKVVRIGRTGVPGVFGTKAVHLQEADERTRPFDPKKMVIDIGARNREEGLRLVRPGDQITWDVEFGPFGDGLWKGRCLDDRIGCAVLVEVLRSARYRIPVYGVFTVQEEIGLRGAAVAAYRVMPQVGICLEGTVCADLPGVDEPGQVTRIGKGPAISFMDSGTIYPPALRRHLVAVAEAEGIPYQWRETTGGGNDAARMSLAGAGAVVCGISVPCRYIHSPVAVCSQDDYRNAVRLVRALLESIGRGELKV